ncbi:MAG: HEPN domain-containing protein [Acidimicrobiales bacterium]
MAPQSRGRTQPASAGDAEAYLAKASEFLRAAQDALQAGNYTAATGNAVHAGIAAADAIAAARSGSIWRGPHDQASLHLERSGPDGKQASRHLRRLIPLKTRAEYDPAPVRATDARAAVTAAERMIVIAEGVIRPPA